ncbi:hypothetical protein A2160_00535 [Candidatus Beckwithbacteria bacterium RBG_13_42_9]|uniref:DUF1704 domain-containing protein n=1 Tax=Candidatus Beckwithbacteria bacterium RBG_13_42_9 TaxID=1797457 RepID=A0A1F5E3S0_9BACT|nr:MAG: hypothetical protein A2160_00535 [Candidatus Beckwithbacteria bacterium RBG_13_42_9]
MDNETVKGLISQAKKILKSSQWLTPINFSEEKEKFQKTNQTNPVFVYPDLPTVQLQKILGEINSVKLIDDQSLENQILKNTLKEYGLKIRLLLSRAKPEFSQISRRLYLCHFDENSLQQARVDAANKLKFESQESLTAQQTAEAIRSYLLKNYGVNDWQVVVSHLTDFYVRIRPREKTIFVSQSINWDFCDLDNTLAHEIDGHVLRAINALNQENPILRQSLPFYIKTEEGLACYLCDYFSTTGDLSRKHHALKYLAGSLALTHSFRDVFNFFMANGFTPSLAYQRTFRLKRGLEDTNQPGLFAKEAVYYEGMMEVKKYLEQGGDIKKLYAGKIGLEDIDQIPVPQPIILPQRLKKT